MQEQLKNIFVTLEVAKMAKEKGFNEWCAAFWDCGVNGYFLFPNLNFNKSKEWGNAPSSYQCIAPTHHQLIEWLSVKNIDVWRGWKDEHIVQKKGFEPSYLKNINDALIEALKLVNNG